MNVLLRFVFVSAVVLTSFASTGTPLWAQISYPAYQTVYRTIHEPKSVVLYRLEYETLMEDRQITTQKPVWNTETRYRRITVARPINETNTQMQRYTVLKPTLETQTRTRRHRVRRPITETVMQNQNYLTYEPVTTMRTETVDQGGFIDQLVFKPAPVRNRLQWLPGTYVTNPVTGTTSWYRGGVHWVPQQASGSYQVQRQYVPNVVQRQVPHTTYVQKVVTRQSPVTVTKFVDEWVEEPYEVQVQKWTEQLMERPVTVTTQRIAYETRDEPYHVQVFKWVAETQTVRVPRMVAKWVPYRTTRMVPKTVVMRVPVDSCGTMMTQFAPTTSYYSAGPPVAVTANQTNKQEIPNSESPAAESTEETPDAESPAAEAEPESPDPKPETPGRPNPGTGEPPADPRDAESTGTPAIDKSKSGDDTDLNSANGGDKPA